MAFRSELSLCAALFLLACPTRALADKLQITSNPSGATVELDGVAAGITPFEKDFPGGFFHKTRTSLGSRLEHAMVARISLTGYATRELKLTEGPMNWISTQRPQPRRILASQVQSFSCGPATDLGNLHAAA